MNPVPLLDLHAHFASVKTDVEAAIADVLATQRFIGGPHVEECERSVAAYSGVEHGIGVSSGTDALLVALMAEGIGAGDEVITTPYSFFATAGCVSRLGARPVFVDIDPVTYNIDPGYIVDRITTKTRAIIPVHLFGQMADMDPIMQIADKHGLCVIEDAAQAIGAEYRGKRAGSIGHYGCFSFFPSKNLGCLGDGGMVVSRDAARAARVRKLRSHGAEPKYFHQLVGGNFRLDAIQAAVVTAKLKHLDAWTKGRQDNAERYGRMLAGIKGLSLPEITAGCRHIFNQYVIRTTRRNELQKHLTSKQIGSEIYYPLCLHQQECFKDLGYKLGDFPNAERAAAESLAIPIYPELSRTQLETVATTIRQFFGQ